MTEPAIIQHQQFHPQRFGGVRQRKQLLLVEIKIGSLPVVHEDWPLPVAPKAAAQMLAVQAVEGP